jgi:hypothetical protein
MPGRQKVYKALSPCTRGNGRTTLVAATEAANGVWGAEATSLAAGCEMLVAVFKETLSRGYA